MNRQRPPARALVAEALLHPVALGALGLLVLNDHVFKSAYPGFVTGKLSDAAGLVVFPLLLHALVQIAFHLARAPFERWWRPAALSCAGVTALGFGAVKSSEHATELFRAGLGALQCLPRTLSGVDALSCRARVVCDPTDLWALPFVLVSLALLRERSMEGERELQPE